MTHRRLLMWLRPAALACLCTAFAGGLLLTLDLTAPPAAAKGFISSRGSDSEDEDNKKGAEQPRTEAPKPEPPKAEAPKVEAPRPEPPKVEPPSRPSQEQPRAEQPKPEPPRQQPAPEQPRMEQPRPEPPSQPAPEPPSRPKTEQPRREEPAREQPQPQPSSQEPPAQKNTSQPEQPSQTAPDRESGKGSARKGGNSEQTGRRERPPVVISSPSSKPDDTRPRPTPPSPPAPKPTQPEKERPKDRDLGDIVKDRKERRDKDRDRDHEHDHDGDHHGPYDVIIIDPETVYVPVPVPVPAPDPDTYESAPRSDSSQARDLAGEPLPPMTGTVEGALEDLRTAWLTSDARYLERHLPVNEELRIYVDHRFSHSLPSQDFLAMTEDAMGESETKSFEFVRIKGTETSLRATARHTYTDPDGGADKVTTLTYYMSRINGVWLIETVDIMKVNSTVGSVEPSAAIDTSGLEATVAVRGAADSSTPGAQFVTTMYRAPLRMVDDIRARSDAYVVGTSLPEN